MAIYKIDNKLFTNDTYLLLLFRIEDTNKLLIK